MKVYLTSLFLAQKDWGKQCSDKKQIDTLAKWVENSRTKVKTWYSSEICCTEVKTMELWFNY